MRNVNNGGLTGQLIPLLQGTFCKFNNAVFLLRDTLENNRVRNRILVSTNKTSRKKFKNVFRFKSQKKDKNM